MNYFLVILGTLIFLFICDIAFSLLKLGVAGIKTGYKYLFSDVGYMGRGYSLNDPARTKTVLIVGDSIALGPGSKSEETIAGRLATRFNVNVINLSVMGVRTKEIVNQLEKVRDQKFALTIVHAGNNDIYKFSNLGKIKDDILLLLDKAKQTSDQVILFRGGNIGSCPFFPFTFAWIYSMRSKKVRKIFQEAAQEKSVVYVEKFMKRSEDVFLKDPYHFYCWDLLHLNGNGYKVWFEYLLGEMKKFNISL